MDINDLLERITEAFRQYQAEMAEQNEVSANPGQTGLGGGGTKSEKAENKMTTEKRVEQHFLKQE